MLGTGLDPFLSPSPTHFMERFLQNFFTIVGCLTVSILLCFLYQYLDTPVSKQAKPAQDTSVFRLNMGFFLTFLVSIMVLTNASIAGTSILSNWLPDYLRSGEKIILISFEIYLFLVALYWQQGIQEDYKPIHIFCQTFFQVIGCGLLVLLSLYGGVQIQQFFLLTAQVALSVISVIAGEIFISLEWHRDLLSYLSKRYKSSPDQTQGHKVFARQGLAYFAAFYVFLTCNKIITWLELYTAIG